jgi:hypothetical protein
LAKTKKPVKVVSDELLEYDPELNSAAELVLIVDGREDRPGSGRVKSVNYEVSPM